MSENTKLAQYTTVWFKWNKNDHFIKICQNLWFSIIKKKKTKTTTGGMIEITKPPLGKYPISNNWSERKNGTQYECRVS